MDSSKWGQALVELSRYPFISEFFDGGDVSPMLKCAIGCHTFNNYAHISF